MLPGQRRMLRSVDDLVGSPGCVSAVPMQERSARTELLVLIPLPIFFVILGLAWAGLVSRPIYLLACAILAACFLAWLLLTTNWIVARHGGEVILARSSIWQFKAVEIVGRYPTPLSLDVEQRTLLPTRVSIDGRILLMGKPFAKRLQTVVGP